jgi:hypothetical protein
MAQWQWHWTKFSMKTTGYELSLTTHVPVEPSRCPAHRCPARMGTELPYFDWQTEFSCRGILASRSLAVSVPVRLACPHPVAIQETDEDGTAAAFSGRHIDRSWLPTGLAVWDSFRSAVKYKTQMFLVHYNTVLLNILHLASHHSFYHKITASLS